MKKIASTLALCAIAVAAAGCGGPTSVMPAVRAHQNISGPLPANVAGALPANETRAPENISGALPAAPAH